MLVYNSHTFKTMFPSCRNKQCFTPDPDMAPALVARALKRRVLAPWTGRRSWTRHLVPLALLLVFHASAPAQQQLKYHVVASFPHDPTAFTQGLLFSAGKLYESTGLYGRSELREVELHSGRVLRKQSLERSDFGEGLALLGTQLVQLTWTSGHGYLWDLRSFRRQGEMPYLFGPNPNAAQGWGLCYNGVELVLSDGSDRLYFLHGASFAPIRSIQVRDAAGPVARLNELECIEGRVYANIWQSDRIVIIDPGSGVVTAQLDLSALYPRRLRRDNVLNGIAWDAGQRRLFVTGKRWPRLYQLAVVPAAAY